MEILVIGDVHGCYYTLKNLIDEHWKPEHQLLIQMGDLINKGPHSLDCILYWQQLEKRFGSKVIMLRGNHEQQFIDNDKRKPGYEEAQKLQSEISTLGLSPDDIRKWLAETPLKWENDNLLITHAGVGKGVEDPFNVNSRHGVLYNKGSLKNTGKMQVKGHSIVEGDKPVFVPKENAWYIDTGAWTKKNLSALVLAEEGEMLRVVKVRTDERDKKKKNAPDKTHKV